MNKEWERFFKWMDNIQWQLEEIVKACDEKRPALQISLRPFDQEETEEWTDKFFND